MNRDTFYGWLCILFAVILVSGKLMSQGTGGTDSGGGGSGGVVPNYLKPVDTNSLLNASATNGLLPIAAGSSITITPANGTNTIASTASGGGGTSTNTGYMMRLSGGTIATTDTGIARFLATMTNTFPAGHLSHVTNAANGSVFTVLTRCHLTMGGNWRSASGGASQVGININSTAADLGNVPSNCNETNMVALSFIAAVIADNSAPAVFYSGTFISNDTIRVNVGGTPANALNPKFWITEDWYGQ